MNGIKCPKCNGPSVRSGLQNNKQRYKCKTCNKRFQLEYNYKACAFDTDGSIIVLLKEGCGVRSISRILRISKNTVLSRILKLGKQIKPPLFHKLGLKFEVDELWSFVGSKKNVIWITYAIEQKNGRTVDFFVGRKTKINIRPIINKLLLLNPKRIYTDRLNIYPSLIPKAVLD